MNLVTIQCLWYLVVYGQGGTASGQYATAVSLAVNGQATEPYRDRMTIPPHF